MKEVIIIKEFDCHFSNDSMRIIGVADSIEKAEELIANKYDNFAIIQNGKNQVWVEDTSGEFTECGVSYDFYKLNTIE